MELASLVTETLLTSAEGTEVFSSTGDGLAEEFESYTTEGLTTGGEIEEDGRAAH